MKPINWGIGEKLKSIRMARTLSLDNTAALTGVSKPVPGQVECVPSVKILSALAVCIRL